MVWTESLIGSRRTEPLVHSIGLGSRLGFHSSTAFTSNQLYFPSMYVGRCGLPASHESVYEGTQSTKHCRVKQAIFNLQTEELFSHHWHLRSLFRNSIWIFKSWTTLDCSGTFFFMMDSFKVNVSGYYILHLHNLGTWIPNITHSYPLSDDVVQGSMVQSNKMFSSLRTNIRNNENSIPFFVPSGNSKFLLCWTSVHHKTLGMIYCRLNRSDSNSFSMPQLSQSCQLTLHRQFLLNDLQMQKLSFEMTQIHCTTFWG